MKVVISESRRDKLIMKFFMERIGEYIKTPNRDDQAGHFIKDGSVTAKVLESGAHENYFVFTKSTYSELINQTTSMFQISDSYLAALISEHLSPIVGVDNLIVVG
jgi:hypothetical protein